MIGSTSGAIKDFEGHIRHILWVKIVCVYRTSGSGGGYLVCSAGWIDEYHTWVRIGTGGIERDITYPT